MIYREKDLGPTLCHFNPNHDPRNGRFAKSSGSDQKRRSAVKKYSAAYDKWSSDRDELDEQVRRSDAQYESVKKLYKKTGKTKLGRVINNARYDTGRKDKMSSDQIEAVKRYSSAYEEWTSNRDKLDALVRKSEQDFDEIKKMHEDTGRFWLERVYNNHKYDRV